MDPFVGEFSGGCFADIFSGVTHGGAFDRQNGNGRESDDVDVQRDDDPAQRVRLHLATEKQGRSFGLRVTITQKVVPVGSGLDASCHDFIHNCTVYFLLRLWKDKSTCFQIP